MSGEVFVSKCGTWVHTCADDPITLDSALEFIAEAAQKADGQGLDRFLFDVRGASNHKSVFEDYEIAHRHLRKLGFSMVSRVALLVSPSDTTHDFFELTASNAGHRWKVFDEESAAVAWLKGQKAPRTGSGHLNT